MAEARTVAVIDTPARVAGWTLAGALVLPAETPDEVRAARAALGPEVDVLLVGPAAARSLDARYTPDGPMIVVLPS